VSVQLRVDEHHDRRRVQVFGVLKGQLVGGDHVDSGRTGVGPVSRVWGTDGEVLRERLLGAGDPHRQLRMMAALLRRRVATPAEPAIRYAAAALHDGVRVAEVEDRLGWSTRRLRQRFLTQMGLSSKRYARDPPAPAAHQRRGGKHRSRLG
jgi:hypothetical protein